MVFAVVVERERGRKIADENRTLKDSRSATGLFIY